MTKTKKDNDMNNCIGAIYTETKTKLSGPIERGVVCYQNQTCQRHDQPYMFDFHWKWNWAFVIDQIDSGMWWKPERITI